MTSARIVLHDPGLASGADPGWLDGSLGPVVRSAPVYPLACLRSIGPHLHLALDPARLARLTPCAVPDLDVLEDLAALRFTGLSPFRDVTCVPGGRECQPHGSPMTWWSVPVPGDATESVWEALVGAMQRHVIATGRMAVSLSGGLDSSALAAAAAEAARREAAPLPLLVSARFPGLACDESEWQDAVAAHLGLELATVNAAGLLLWPASAAAMARGDSPLVDAMEAVHAATGALARRAGCQGMAWGVGGDEVFAERGLEVDLFRSGRILAGTAVALRARLARRRAGALRTLGRGVLSAMRPSRLGLDGGAAASAGSWRHAALRHTLADPRLAWRTRMAAATVRRAGLELALPMLDRGVIEAVAGFRCPRVGSRWLPRALLREAVAPHLPSPVVRRVDKADLSLWIRERVMSEAQAMVDDWERLQEQLEIPWLPRRITPADLHDDFLTQWSGLGILHFVEVHHSPGEVAHDRHVPSS